MNEQSSRFGLNLTAQLAGAVLLSYYSSRLPLEFREASGTIQTFLYASFSFGLIYGFFRMCGTRGGVLEWYYQHVPFGLVRAFRSNEAKQDASASSPWSGRPVTHEMKNFSWELLLTPRYIRYAGILLIVSAVFAFFFRIRWDALQKILAADLGAILLVGAAEWAHRKQSELLSALTFLVSYALFQFSLTLIFSVLQEDPGAPLAHIELWLSLKVITMVLGLPLLRRYAAEYSAIVYVFISYSAPLTVYRVVPVIDPVVGLLWTVTISLVTLFYAAQTRSFELAPLNSVLAAAHALLFYGASLYGLIAGPIEPVAIATFVTLAVLFLMQLGSDLLAHLRDPRLDERLLSANAVISHVVTALALTSVQTRIPALAGSEGFTCLGLSFAGCLGCFTLSRIGIRNRYVELLLHIALTLSAIGLFLQTKGTWTAVVFLLYSCVALAASLLAPSRTTKAFAFFVLTLSIVKLYTEGGRLFDSITGSGAVFLIGCLLLVLSTRFDALKQRLGSNTDDAAEKPPTPRSVSGQ